MISFFLADGVVGFNLAKLECYNYVFCVLSEFGGSKRGLTVKANCV